MSQTRPKDQAIKVLIVDDDSEYRDGIGHVLKERQPDVEVDTVYDGNTAVILWEKKKHQIIVLDMMLPKRSGFLVLEKIRDFPDDFAHIIMITANEGKRHEQYAWRLGVDQYYVKCSKEGNDIENVVDLVEDAIRRIFD